MTDWAREAFKKELFNLITMYENTDLVFSDRLLITQELLKQYDLLVLRYKNTGLQK